MQKLKRNINSGPCASVNRTSRGSMGPTEANQYTHRTTKSDGKAKVLEKKNKHPQGYHLTPL